VSLCACCRRSRTPQRGRGAPRSGDRPAEAEGGLRTETSASAHAVEEVGRRSVDEGPREAGIGPRRRKADFELKRQPLRILSKKSALVLVALTLSSRNSIASSSSIG